MKSLFITGGSSGIGKSLALQAAAAQWHVFVGYAQGEQRAKELVATIQKKGGQAMAIPIRLENAPSITEALQTIAQQTNTLEALVLCASPAPTLQSFTKTSADEFSQQWNVHVVGNHTLIAQVWKQFFSKNAGGHIVALLTAALGPPPRPHMTSYLVAKQGMKTLLDCALAELGASGLRVSTISPGYTETPMLATFHAHILEQIKLAHPEKPFLSPEEVADCILQALAHPPATPLVSHSTVEVPVHG